MRIFKTRAFARFAAKARLSDLELRLAAGNVALGIGAADLGAGVVKQRVARPGGGKSGGYRVIVFFRRGDRTIFVHGFAKSDLDNIRQDELAVFKKFAAILLGYSDVEISRALETGALTEIT